VSREEQTLSRQKASENKFRSRQGMLHWGEKYGKNVKFIRGKYLAAYLQKLSVKSVLSLGSGECYHEYAIKLVAPEIAITATDFDPFVVDKVSAFLPEIDNVEVFDIKEDDFARFQGKYDTILMIGVEYVFSDDEMIDFFKRVSMIGANHIIILSSYLTFTGLVKSMIWLRLGPLKRLLLGQREAPPPGRFHGWARSKGEFVRLTRMAGTVKLQEVITGKPFGKSQALLHIIPENRRGIISPQF